MIWKFIGPLPIPVIVTERFIDATAGACARTFVILVRPIYIERGDEALILHELEHVRQFLCLPFIHSFLYWAFDGYRLWAELHAYRAQLDWYESNPDWCAKFPHHTVQSAAKALSTNYGIDVSRPRAEDLLNQLGGAQS